VLVGCMSVLWGDDDKGLLESVAYHHQVEHGLSAGQVAIVWMMTSVWLIG